jgi:hypothetical protein
VVAIRHPSFPRWNPPRKGPEVTISCAVVASRIDVSRDSSRIALPEFTRLHDFSKLG